VTRREWIWGNVVSLCLLTSVACATGVSPPEEGGASDVASSGSAAGGRGGTNSFSVSGPASAAAGSGGSAMSTSSAGHAGNTSGGAGTAGGAAAGQGGSNANGGNANGGSSGSSAQAGNGGQACAPHQFEYAANDKSLHSVHVSGTFNAWAEPGTPLAHDADSNVWKASVQLAAGNYEYKFVLDGTTWLPDPKNPETHSDTFGGVNSVLTVVCP
jgi:hypothetical protein